MSRRGCTVTVWTCVLALLAQTTHAQIDIQAQGGAPRVLVKSGKLAVFQPKDNEVWIIGEASHQAVGMPDVAGADGTGRVNAAWRTEQLQVAGGQGVRITGAAPRRWQVRGQPNAWVITPGHTSGKNIASADARTLTDASTLVATARDGSRYAVALVPGRVQGQNQNMVLAGVLRGQDLDTLAAVDAELARIEPAAGDADMPVHAGEPLQAVSVPQSDAEELTPLHAKPYRAGDVLPFTVPAGWGWRGDTLVPLSQLQRGLQQAVADGAVRDAEQAVADMREAPETVVEHSEPVESHKAAVTTTPPQIAQLHLPTVKELMQWPEDAGQDTSHNAGMPALQKALAACAGMQGPAKGVHAPDGHDNHGEAEQHSALPWSFGNAWQVLIPVAQAEETESHESAAASAHEDGEPVAFEEDLVPHVVSDAAVGEENGEASAEGAGGHGESKGVAELAPDAPGKSALAWGVAEFTACQGTAPVMQARLQLARAALVEGRPQDALAQLALLPQTDIQQHDVPLPLEGRWLTGIANVMLLRYEDADRLLGQTTWPKDWQPQVNAWHSAAKQGLEDSRDAVRIWPQGEDVAAGYPARLRLALQRALAEAQVAANSSKQAQAFVDQLAGSYAKDSHNAGDGVPPWLARLQGVVRLGGAEEREGLDLLASAANQTQDPLTAARAKYDFVKALQKRGELDTNQIITYLNELRLFWRGGKLETQILDELGDLYLSQGDYRRALDNWQTLVKLDPESSHMNALTEKMSQALVAAFDPDKGIAYTPLTFAGLYFDYKELLPVDARGDQVTEKVGDMLADMDLPVRAAQLYEQLLLNAEQPPIDTARIGLKLAKVYEASSNAAGALQTLDKYEHLARNTQQAEDWRLAEARALINLKRYDAAAKALGGLEKGLNTPEGRELRADIAWRTKNWPMVTALLGADMQRIKDDALDEPRMPVEALRMAFASGMQDDTAALEKLAADLAPVMAKDKVGSDMVAAMAGEAGVSGTLPGANGALGQLATTLRDMNVVAGAAAKERQTVETQSIEREDYNNKMQYMELLPPPAI